MEKYVAEEQGQIQLAMKRCNLIDEDGQPLQVSWIADVGRAQGVVPTREAASGTHDVADAVGFVEQIEESIFRCNELCRRMRPAERVPFTLGPRASTMVRWVRLSKNEAQLKDFVTRAHQALCEGYSKELGRNSPSSMAGEVIKFHRRSGGSHWALDQARQYYFHEPDQRRSEQDTLMWVAAQKRRCLKYAGVILLSTPDHVEAFHLGLLKNLAQDMTDLYQFCFELAHAQDG